MRRAQVLEALARHRGPLVMGVLNTTPDSFSDGGSWESVEAAVAHAEQMLIDGAHIIDVGGESSRPGADPVPLDEEMRRTIPVIEALARRCVMSIDTAKAEVADAALIAGADIVNDITASLETVAGEHGAGWIAMHKLGEPKTMQDDPKYNDVVAEVQASLVDFRQRAERAGVPELWVDPGIGFGKTTKHNLVLLRDLEKLTKVGARLAIGVSRKRLIGQIHSESDETAPDLARTGDRREGSVLAGVWSWSSGVHILRVHDVAPAAMAARLLVEQDA